ncbi:MAG: lipopolysaccharide biosynthesis protein [Henriciella sp.]|nr:lipopolysaccharide biosynthesis protein [Henriciella sp.]
MSYPAPPQADGMVGRILKNMGLLFGGKTSAVLIGLAVLAIAARALTIEELGILLLLYAFIALMTGIATFKSWQALIQFGAQPVETGDLPRFHRLLRFLIGLDIAAALFAALLSVTVFLVIRAHLGLPDEIFWIVIAYCLLSATNLRSSPLGVLRLYDRFDLISLHDQAVPIVRLTGASLGLMFGGGLTWFILVWMAAALATNLLMPALAIRELARRGALNGLFSRRLTLKAPEAGIWRYVWMSNIDATINLVDKQMPTLLAGALLGPAFAAMFKIARDISDVLGKGARLLNQVLYPELVRLMIAGSAARAVRVIIHTSAYLLGAGIVLAALINLFGPPLFAIALTDAYEGVAPIAMMLVIAAALLGATIPIYSGLYALGSPGQAALSRAISVALTLILFVTLSHATGQSGPGWAMVIGAGAGLVLASTIALLRAQGVRDASGQADFSDLVNDATSSPSADPTAKSG